MSAAVERPRTDDHGRFLIREAAPNLRGVAASVNFAPFRRARELAIVIARRRTRRSILEERN
jgi:hypothetical protein